MLYNKKNRKGLSKNLKKGFTLVELLIVLGIFAVMSGVVLGSYRTYDSNALFANATEDVVLALRQAQVYGSGAKGGEGVCGGLTAFDCSYGVYFSMAAPASNGITVFADTNNNHVYNVGDAVIAGASATWPSSISVTTLLCGGVDCATNVASVSFKRPNPDAYIADVALFDPNLPSPYNAIAITIADTKSGKTSTVTVTRTGQISLQ